VIHPFEQLQGRTQIATSAVLEMATRGASVATPGTDKHEDYEAEFGLSGS
jgi:hypothetical protein